MKDKLKLLHISDTHGYHRLLNIPKDIDIVVHSGDFSNYYDVYKNEPEAKDFIQWFGNLDVEYKVLICGNHDALGYHWNTEFRNLCTAFGIIYLENEECYIEGRKFWGSPNTPNFGNWYFMKSRDKMDKHWSHVPDDIDVFVSHGPCKTILDLSIDRDNKLEFCGDKSLYNHVVNRIKPKLFLHGHIHNHKDINNQGIFQLPNHPTIFSNGSVVADGKFGILTNQGNIFEI